ncbi:alpha/beta hydrolase [Aquabacterium sp.]|uniref:alpha/beta hydrolase n=1 Tax=Aquabacterium sp. TaxID=1872578 RepID=UPI001995D84F|nr:alpha/beta hydrolase [Aquabacterium sp.]MBC7700499.1 alpha/beta hydrolase [Aquabacterium sp.]
MANAASFLTEMTLKMLDKVERAGLSPLHQQPVAQARLSYRMGVGAMEGERVEVARVDNFSIPGPAGSIPARLWAPSHDAGLPVLLYLHGGGFVVGGIDTCEAMCRRIAQQSGAAVVAIDYRLAPEHHFPAGLDDSFAALQWLAAEGASLGLDPKRIAVGGDSAGGTLGATLALMARDAGLALALQLLFYPSVEPSAMTASYQAYSKNLMLDEPLMRWFETQARGPGFKSDWHREPMLAASHQGVAPAWIGLAECDPLADEGRKYAKVLQEAGVPVQLTVWPGVVHDFINMGRFIPEAYQAHAAAAQALKAAFGL